MVLRLFVPLVLGLVLATGALAVERLKGDKGNQKFRFEDLSRGTQLDMRGAVFNVVNSRNKNPTAERKCRSGNGRVNRYPVAVEDSRDVRIVGGLFRGHVPQSSDWLWTYCNSAALRVERSPNAYITEQRIDRSWDAIRIDNGTKNFTIDRVWVTDTRDDCIENDELMSGTIRNSLFDGCFSGISVAPTSRTSRSAVVALDSVLVRMKSFVYRGKRRHVLPIKLEGRTARLEIKNSVFAVESSDLVGGHNAKAVWRSIGDCSNNLLLWLGDGKLPEEYSRIPKCFKVETGSRAHAIWERKKADWINCNAQLYRLSSDPKPRPKSCQK